jgi:hypothetical protein
MFQEETMSETHDEVSVDVDSLAREQGMPYPVRLSESLENLLQPNEYLSGLGIRFSERIANVISVLKGNLIPRNGGPVETLPAYGVGIPYAITQGPFIREIPITIKAELHTDDSGKQEILLTVVQEPH